MLTSVAFAANTSIVEYTTSTNEETGATTVTATAFAEDVDEDAVKLYTAVYDAQGNLVTAKGASTEDSLLLKNTVPYGEGQVVKSFAWEGAGNTPVEMPATYGKTAISANDVEITFGGKSFEEYVGSALAFDDEDHVAEYTVKLDESKIGEDGNITIPTPEVMVKDNGIVYEVVNDEEAFTTTITLEYGRTAIVDSEFTSKTRYIYAPQIKETVVINYNVAMVTESMTKKGNVGFLTSNYYYERSYTFDYSDNVTTSDAIEGKKAVLSAISVDGVDLEGFSPDVFEYTYTVSASKAEAPKVGYVVAGSATAHSTTTAKFPGETVITVTEGDVTNEYTITYTCDDEMVTELALNPVLLTYADKETPAPVYAKDVQVGQKNYADRGTFPIEYIAPEYVGLDRIQTCLGWGNDGPGGNSTYEYTDEFRKREMPDWFTFRVSRGTKVILLNNSAAADSCFDSNWTKTVVNSDNAYMVATASTKLEYVVRYTRHYNAGDVVKIPAAYTSGRTFTVLLEYDGWNNYKDITLNAEKLAKNPLVILVPKDSSRDVLVTKNEDGTYSDVSWVVDKARAIDAYDYELDSQGNRIYKWDASRATGESKNDNIVKITAGGANLPNFAVKNLVFTDGDYVLGSRASQDRHPLNGQHFLDNMPAEFENANYIVTQFNGDGHSNVEYKFSVNDNLKKIVVLNLDDVANPTIGSETSVEATLSDNARPYYTYQSVQANQQAAANLTIAYQIAKGNMTADDVYGGFKIRRYSALHALMEETVAADETKMSEDLYMLASDGTAGAYANIKWFLGEIIVSEDELVTDLKLLAPKEYIATEGSDAGQTQTLSPPEVRKFTSASKEKAASAFVNANDNLPGVTVSYPQWLDAEHTTYIAPSYFWSGVPTGSYYYGDEVFDSATPSDVYSFKVTEDSVVMMFTNKDVNNFWADAEGWTKTALTGDDIVVLNRHKGNANVFSYPYVYTKKFEKGSTVTIKNPQTSASIPIVFVKKAK